MPKIQTTSIFSRIQEAKDKGYTTVSEQGSSRCLAAGTLVRMFDGRLKPVEQIVVGDRLMNIDGNGFNTVIETHNGIDEMFTIHQKRGIDYTVNSKHILTLRQTRAKQHKVAIEGFKSAEKRRVELLPYDRNMFYDMEVGYYANQSRNFQLRYSGFKRTDIELPNNNLPIDPYYLGMWLGDGSSSRPYEITNIDKEILEYFYTFANGLGVDVRQIDEVSHSMKICEEGTHNLRKKGKIREFCDYFRAFNLIKNKHIPEQYIYTSKENRLKLLAGLIDTDGSVTGRNTIEISQKKECIIDAVVEICRLTGFYTNGKRSKISSMKRADGTKYHCRIYSVEINHNDFKELNRYIRLPRKRIEKNCDRDYFVTSLSIEPVGKGEYYGFTLDDSPYFLLEDGTVCHNSGKTFNTVLWLCVYCLQNSNTTVSIVRQTLPALKRSVLRDVKDNLLNLGVWNERSFNRSEFIYTFPNGSWIEFFSADNEQKLRGSKRQILYVNEGNELKFIEWQQLQMRTTDFSIIDYNPSFTDDHWLCDLNKDPRTYHFITTYKENPFLEKKVIEEIESLQWKNPSLWRVYGLGLQAIIEGLIFENVEYIDEIPRWCKKHRYLGMDFGYTNDPTAIEEVCILDNAIYIDEVCYQTKMLGEDIIRVLKERTRLEHYEYEVISESADPRLIDEIGNAGIDIHPVSKFGGSVMAGITKMLEFKIYVTKRSTNVTKEFKNYTYRQDKEGHWLNEPIDLFNHAIDGIRYVVLEKVLGAYGEGLDAEDLADML